MTQQKVSEKANAAIKGKALAKPPKTLAHANSSQIADIFKPYLALVSQVLPKHITGERVLQVASTVVTRNPSVGRCTTATIVGSVVQASICGLDLNPMMGECALIPRKNGKTGDLECQFLIQYQGYIKLMRQSALVSNVYAHVVYEKDLFEYELGLEPKLVHKPRLDGDQGEMVYVYGIVKFTNGQFIIEVMNKKQVMDVKAKSEAKDTKFSPWKSAFDDQMWRKSVIRRIRKYVPLEIEKETLATDGAVIYPDMFDKKEKKLTASKIAEFEILEDEKTPLDTPEEKPKETEPEPVPKVDKWIEKVNGLKERIIKHSSEEKFLSELGALGYEPLEEVAKEHEAKVEKALILLLNDLIIKKQ